MKLLRELKGVGEKTEKLLEKAGLATVQDLLCYYPRRYEEYASPIRIRDVREGEMVTIQARVSSGVSVNAKGRIPVTSASLQDDSGTITAAWFRSVYLRNILKRGSVFLFRGICVRRGKTLQLQHPEVFLPEKYREVNLSLQPVYRLTAGLSNKTVQRLVRNVLSEKAREPDPLPPELRERYGLCDESFAEETIHFPKDKEQLIIARNRLVFDEFLFFILSLQQLKENAEVSRNAFPMKKVWTTERVIEELPYTLTSAQQNVWRQVERDLTGTALTSRLIQGDVGSGKTILAFLAMILAAENGWQSALMVPTEVLSHQHYESLCALLAQNGLEHFCPVLLTGSQTAKEKKEICEKIASGEARMIIGTHALIQEKVKYKNLALAVTDEQHRFGVRQRQMLSGGADVPHVLVMSATPIPRTLAIILFGDLDISVLDEKPKNRLPVKNCVVGTHWRANAWNFIKSQAEEGRQAYVICPMVHDSSEIEAENVTDYTESLQKALPENIAVCALHGKMPAREKNRIMNAFASGEIDVLVSTTVIEVGVNVPNATVMMVENAERFGLAQLHQLRGRVGRGEHQSYCIFMQGNEDEETRKRLEILNSSNDGFFIAGEDLRLRGPGDLFGIRQSGVLEFGLADIYQDAAILQKASEAAREIVALDPDLSLPQNLQLRKRLTLYMEGNLKKLTI